MAELGSLVVSLSLDANNFNGNITQANRHIKAMGSELQAIKAKGADYENSLEGMGRKKEVLTRQTEASRLKLEELRKEYDKNVESGDKSAAQMERLANSVNRAEADYNRLERELADVTEELRVQSSQWTQAGQKMQDVGGKMKSVGDGMTSIGKDMSMKVTTPIVAMGTAVVKTAMDFEAQMDRVGAIAGATGSEMDQLSAKAMELGASTSKSASEVAIGMENMAAMGFEVNEIMAAMPGIISAAEASGADMALTADVVASSLNIWGMKASEASRVADILAQTANQSAADITDMQYALKYAGPPAAALGVSLEELSASIGIMTDAGMQGEQAGTTLRAALLSLLNPSEKNSKMMDKLGIEVTDLEGNFVGISGVIGNLSESFDGMTDANKAATLASIVGTEAVSGMLSLMAAGPEEIDRLTASLENSGGASKATADLMKDNLKGALEELGGSIETASIELGNELIPIIRDAAGTVQGLVEKFSDLSPEAKKTVLAIGGIVAAAGPLLVIGGTIMSGIGGLVTTVGALSTAVGAAGGASAVLGGALAALTGPVAGAALLIAGIGTAAVLVTKEMSESSIQVEDWSNKVSESTAKAVGGFMELSDQASGHLTTLSITGQTVTQEMATNITTIFSQMGQQVLSEMQSDHEEQLAAVTNFYANSNVLIESEEAEILAKTAEYQANKEKQISDGNARIAEIMNTASNEKRALTLAEEAEITRIHSTMKDNAVKYMTESEREQKVIYEAIKNNASELSALQAAEVVKNSVKQKDEVVKEAEEQYKKAVAEIIKQRDEMGVISGSQAKQLIEDAGRQRDETIKAAEDQHQKIVSEAKKQAEGHVNQVNWETGEIKSKWQVMKQDVSARMKEMGADIKREWSQAYNDTKKSVSNMATSVNDKFQSMGKSVGIKMNEAKDAVVNKWNEAENFLKSIDLLQVGKDIVQGLVNGINEKIDDVAQSAKNLGQTVINSVSNVLQRRSPARKLIEIGRDVGEGLAIGIEEKEKRVANVMKDLSNNLLDITNHYRDEEKKITDKAATAIAKIEERSAEDIEKIQRTAKSKKRQLTQDELIKIQRLEEDSAAKIAEIEKKATSDSVALISKAQKDKLEEIKLYINDKKTVEELSAFEEAAIWQSSLEQFDLYTKERVEVQKNYQKATEEISNEISAITKTASDDVSKIVEEFLNQSQKLNDELSNNINKRAQDLEKSTALFDRFKNDLEVTGEELTANLQSQVDGFRTWQEQIETLAAKAIDEGLIEELRQMGPKALPQLTALNAMTDEQLTKYSDLYRDRAKLAREQSESEHEKLKQSTVSKIEEMRTEAMSKLDVINNDWVAKMKGLTNGTEKELTMLKEIGAESIDGFMAGLASADSKLQPQLTSIADNVEKTLASAMKSKSLSNIGKEVGTQLASGLSDATKDINETTNEISTNLTNSLERANAEAAALTTKIREMLTAEWQLIQQDIETSVTKLYEAIKGNFDSSHEDTSETTTESKTFLSKAWEDTRKNIDLTVTKMVDATKKAFSTIQSEVESSMNKTKKTQADSWQSAENQTNSATSKIYSNIREKFQQITSAVEGEMRNTSNAVSTGMQNIVSTTNTEMNNMSSAVSIGMQNTNNEVNTGLRNIEEIFNNFSLYGQGIAMMQGLIDGIYEMQSGVVDAIVNAVQSAVSAAEAELDINSPSGVFKQIGIYSGEGYIVGLEAMNEKIARAAANMANVSSDNFRAGMSSNKYDYSKNLSPKITINSKGSGTKELDRYLRKLLFQM